MIYRHNISWLESIEWALQSCSQEQELLTRTDVCGWVARILHSPELFIITPTAALCLYHSRWMRRRGDTTLDSINRSIRHWCLNIKETNTEDEVIGTDWFVRKVDIIIVGKWPLCLLYQMKVPLGQRAVGSSVYLTKEPSPILHRKHSSSVPPPSSSSSASSSVSSSSSMGQNGSAPFILHRDTFWCLLHLRISASLYGVSVHQWVKLSTAATSQASPQPS